MTPSSRETHLTIAAVERDTGIGKDTLRVWERRYGFPQPQRSELGERLYPTDQIERLRLIKRLMDQGLRPGKVVTEPTEALQSLLGSSPKLATSARRMPAPATETGSESETKTEADTATDQLIRQLHSGEVDAFRQGLQQQVDAAGLSGFICETLPALNRGIGEAWVAGELRIFEEHLYTEVIQNLLRAAINAMARPISRPQVLLTTLKDEEHLLGLLMAEALISAEGAWCLSLGAQTPVSDIIGAVEATTADVVALSFSSAYPWRKAKAALTELRHGLPERVALWVGGGHLSRHARSLPGIRCFNAISDIPLAIADWRRTHS